MNLRKIEEGGNPNDPTSNPSPRLRPLPIENPLKSAGFPSGPGFFQEAIGKKAGPLPCGFQTGVDDDHVFNNLTDSPLLLFFE